MDNDIILFFKSTDDTWKEIKAHLENLGCTVLTAGSLDELDELLDGRESYGFHIGKESGNYPNIDWLADIDKFRASPQVPVVFLYTDETESIDST